MRLVFATNNKNKLSEIRDILGKEIEVLSLKDISCNVDIPETADTLEGNSMQKAEYIYNNYGMNVFADDTGLEVDALNGEPGVYSARYASGEGHDSEANIKKLLSKLNGVTNRKARFRTSVALILDGERYSFEGIVNGEILTEKSGTEGFGYDPIFKPDGYDKSFAELGIEIKNKISHRANAIKKLTEFLKTKQ